MMKISAQKLSYEQSFLQCVYSPQAVHWMLSLPIPKFLELKSVLGTVSVPWDVPRQAAAS